MVDNELQIHALIGFDHYRQLVIGKVIEGESGPIAIQALYFLVLCVVLLNRRVLLCYPQVI